MRELAPFRLLAFPGRHASDRSRDDENAGVRFTMSNSTTSGDAIRSMIACCALCCLCAMPSGCGPTSDCPLIDADRAKQDPRLFGTWVLAEEDSQGLTFLHIGEDHSHEMDPDQNPGQMQAWLISTRVRQMGDRAGKKTWDVNQAGPPMGVSFNSVRVGDTWIASISTNVDLPASMSDAMKEEEWLKDRDRFWFVKYEVDGDKLSLWLMDDDFVASAVKEGKLQGTAERTYPFWKIRLAESQEKLRRFVEQNADRGLFPTKRAENYKRVRVPGPRGVRE
jgi:hypothetical protein